MEKKNRITQKTERVFSFIVPKKGPRRFIISIENPSDGTILFDNPTKEEIEKYKKAKKEKIQFSMETISGEKGLTLIRLKERENLSPFASSRASEEKQKTPP